MDKKLEYAKRWFDKARNDLLNADNNLAAEARQAAQEVLEWMQSRFRQFFE